MKLCDTIGVWFSELKDNWEERVFFRRSWIRRKGGRYRHFGDLSDGRHFGVGRVPASGNPWAREMAILIVGETGELQFAIPVGEESWPTAVVSSPSGRSIVWITEGKRLGVWHQKAEGFVSWDDSNMHERLDGLDVLDARMCSDGILELRLEGGKSRGYLCDADVVLELWINRWAPIREECGRLSHALKEGFLDPVPESLIVMVCKEDGRGEYAGCGVKQVEFESRLEKIEEEILADNPDLVNVVIPASVWHVGWHAFYNCTSLMNLMIEGDLSRVADWDRDAFEGCPCEEYYTLLRQDAPNAEGHVFHADGKGVLLSYEGPGGEVKVPEGIRSIGTEAFAFCTQVTGVILPEGVRRIARRAFYRSGIKTFSLPATLNSIEELAFFDTHLQSIEIPDQATDVKEKAFCGAGHLEKAKLPEGLCSLEPQVFSGCGSLKEVMLPKSLKHIEGRAFMNCTSLAHITLPEGLVSVWTRAFCGCRSLREIYLGDSVKAIGHAAFQDCTALEKVRIPEGLEMKNCNAFRNAGRVMLTGPGAVSGLIVDDDDIRYYPDSKKLVIPEGVDQLPIYALGALSGIEILDLPGSLKYYSWSVLSKLGSLRLIVTDRDALAAEIALLLDLECTDRKGQKFVYQTPEKPGEWIVEQDEKNNGIRLMGCRGRIGHTGEADYTTVVIPDEIDGRPVTSIGREAFYGYDEADAFYIPDSVRRIESGAFARNGYCRYGGKLFLRLPKKVIIAGGAFAETVYITKERVREEALRKAAEETDREKKNGFEEKTIYDCAVHAADDSAIGTGTEGRPALKPNIWQYFDRLSREERIRELTHSFRVSGENDGAGWASIELEIDGEETSFRISYVGDSPADFRSFAEELEDGENEYFGWQSEPGYYPWSIQRRGGIFYVNVPVIEKSFFISREAFLCAAEGLTGDW
ncbi:MAG: leucine-rich repeat domain-containing protein [Eubacterium sp.]|nr:leucine-rich repeat domain-containing protein [Eubacterium sp.]